MMTTNPDPVERVARVLAERREFDWDDIPDRPKWRHTTSKQAFRDDADELFMWFAEQDVPIEKLLTGEYVAVPKKETER